eukprot:gene987-27847_t
MVRTPIGHHDNPAAAKLFKQINSKEQAAMEAEGAIFPKSSSEPITDEQIKVLKVLRRKLRNKASAQRSRDQDKERLKAMEIEFLTKAAGLEEKRSRVTLLEAENEIIRVQMIDEAGGGMPFTGGGGGLAAGAAAAVLNIFTTDPTTAAAYADVTESEAQLGEVLAVALQDIPE